MVGLSRIAGYSLLLAPPQRIEYNPVINEGGKMSTEAVAAIMEGVAACYAKNLLGGEGREAREHLLEIGINSRAASEMGIGYALPRWASLKIQYGDDDSVKTLVSLGLLIEGESVVYDKFRDRVIFPIRDSGGEVVAFCGMAIEGEPKYIYSVIPEGYESRYLERITAASGEMSGVVDATVEHEDWCGMMNGMVVCTCHPDIWYEVGDERIDIP